MNRSDYELIAGALALARPDYEGNAANADNRGEQYRWETCCRLIGDVLQADNLRFDRIRFVKACLA